MDIKVAIEEYRGLYRLRLPRSIYPQRYISTGLHLSPENYKKVQLVAWEIEEDAKSGYLDITKYKQRFQSKVITVTTSLVELWAEYCEYKKPNLAPTTYQHEYVRAVSRFIRMPEVTLDAQATFKHLTKVTTPARAKLVLEHLSRCCQWGVDTGQLKTNPYQGLATKVQMPRAKPILPFTYQEREAILAALPDDYGIFIKFLFLTGCRTGEAVALQWKHVSPSYILFAESYDNRYKVRKPTKTNVARRFPCNDSLRHILVDIQPKQTQSDQLVFSGVAGLPVCLDYVRHYVWKPTLTKLVSEGLVTSYRTLYNTRHTFISMCLEAGISVQQVAAWVGNSPEVIYKHYAGVLSSPDVPDLRSW